MKGGADRAICTASHPSQKPRRMRQPLCGRVRGRLGQPAFAKGRMERQPPLGYQPLPGDLRHSVRKLAALTFRVAAQMQVV